MSKKNAEPKKKKAPAKAKAKPTNKKKGKLEIPKFFTDPSPDPSLLPVEKLDAEAFLFGLKPYEESHSANITYLGPRRKLGRNIVLARRGTDPTKLGGFKLYMNSCIFWAEKENTFKIKDLNFIQEAFKSPNLVVKWVKDPPLDIKDTKRAMFQRDRSRILGLPIRIKAQYVQAGQKIDLRPGDAEEILEIIKEQGIKEENKHMIDWLKTQLAPASTS